MGCVVCVYVSSMVVGGSSGVASMYVRVAERATNTPKIGAIIVPRNHPITGMPPIAETIIAHMKTTTNQTM